MTGRKNRALQVPPIVSYKALEKFPKALYGTTGGTCSARFFRLVMTHLSGKLSEWFNDSEVNLMVLSSSDKDFFCLTQ